jgi:lipoprotein NlpI
MNGLLLAVPEMASDKAQVSIIRYTDTLYRVTLTEKERAEVLFQRGVVFDSLGLTSLAIRDYSAALSLNPMLADAHNSLGVLYIQAGMHLLAYEEFDAALEINPDYDFAYLNRGIALYYGGRSELAQIDTEKYLAKDPSDPFRLLWHYIIVRETSTELEANAMLVAAKPLLDNEHWASSLIDFYLGGEPESHVMASLVRDLSGPTEFNYRLSEAYFYLGKFSAIHGNYTKAENYYKLTLATNVYEYIEHKYARIELGKAQQSQFEQFKAQQ